jgi:hypothetical protein
MFRLRLLIPVATLLALALPGAASAAITVDPPIVNEGDSGLTHVTTTVKGLCQEPFPGTYYEETGYASCVVSVHFTQGTAQAFGDYVWDPPKEETFRVSHEGVQIDMGADVIGDKVNEPNENLQLVVSQRIIEDVYNKDRTDLAFDKTFVAAIIVNDDGPTPGAKPITIKRLGKAKPPLNASEKFVQRTASETDASCTTAPTSGFKGAFGAWGYYVPGCVTTLPCPEGKTCVAQVESAINSTATARVTLNARTRVLDANGAETWRADVSCEGNQQCSARDQTEEFPGGSSVQLQCNGVQARKSGSASEACRIHLLYRDDA